MTGTLKNVGGTDLCHFSSAPLKLQPALMDMVKLPAGEAATPFEHLALPDTKLQVIKLPNEQVLHAQLLLPVDVSKITAAAPLTGVPGAAALSANLQPCEVLDSLQEPKLVEGFTASLSKLAGAAAPATAAADDTKAAVTAATGKRERERERRSLACLLPDRAVFVVGAVALHVEQTLARFRN